MAKKYTLEADIDDFVKEQFNSLGLRKHEDYNEKSSMSESLKSALKGSAKTNNKSNFGQPDFTVERYRIPVIIENKLKNNRHIAKTKECIKTDDAAIRNYAVNGAIYYARNVITSKKYDEAIAIGITGDDIESIRISVYYVFSSSLEPKEMCKYTNLNFLQNEESFEAFYADATITETERHKYLVQSRDEILRQAKRLNKLMDKFNIGVDQRVVYVSGMLLSMQDVKRDDEIIDYGLTPNDLKGIQTPQNRDSVIVLNHIDEFLDTKELGRNKKEILGSSFKSAISIDETRDEPQDINSIIGDKLKEKSSITKQIFTFLYEYVYLAIDLTQGAIDIMAEMYSTFLKYALSDGASLGKVLTPPYVTTLMAKLLDIDDESRVMDIATGSAAFLVAAMDRMIIDANNKLSKGSSLAKDKINNIKSQQLLGIEIDAKMYTLAAANMILRGDGSTRILKGDSFTRPENIFTDFKADRLLLNPPFSADENGLPFFEFGLDHMVKHGIGAVIIMDSAGAGKARATARRILSKHRMIASIKMPQDLFIPNAIVQTSIYIFEAKVPHRFKKDKVKFIDFRNDGYKRTKRAIKDIDSPAERYNDLYWIYNLGMEAPQNELFHDSLWDLDKVYYEHTITEDGDDWNFEKYFKYSNAVSPDNIFSTLKEHLCWEIGNTVIPKHGVYPIAEYKEFKNFEVKELFVMDGATPSYDKGDLTVPTHSDVYDYITRQSTNRGICAESGFIAENGLHPAGTFSLGLMQMIFFYRERGWYAGQFVKKVSLKSPYNYMADKYAYIYLEAILNGLSKKLLSVLVRNVAEVFYNSSIVLPVTNEGEIDFNYMSNFIRTQRCLLFDGITQFINDEQQIVTIE